MRRLTSSVVFLVVTCLSLWPGLYPLGAQPAPKAPPEGTADESMRLLSEAVTKLRKQAMPPLQSREIVRGMLKAYLRSLDPFSDYLSAEEVKQSKLMQESQYAGVGMELEQEQSGRIVCFPYPESPAMQAGIETGDSLEAVDGVSTAGLSILTVGMKIRGQVGTAVGVRVAKAHGGQKDVQIIRSAFEAKSVLVEPAGPLPIVQLSTFTPRTPQALQNALSTLRNATAVVLDLRGNPGGALFGGIEAAKLFVTHGQKITSLKTQEGIKDYRNDLATPPVTSARLYLWQDAWTASAAEVFIAALSQNQRAVTIGTFTFGKGIFQDVIALADGSALRLTTGYIQTPDGTLYHQQGLKPTYPLDPAASTADFMARTLAVLDHKAVTSPPPNRMEKPTATESTTPLLSHGLALQITLKPSPPPAPLVTQPRVLLLCFDKEFDQDYNAEIWSMEVRASLREQWEHYLVPRNKPDGMKFVVCLGPFTSKEAAERQRLRLADSLQTPLFTEEVESRVAQE